MHPIYINVFSLNDQRLEDNVRYKKEYNVVWRHDDIRNNRQAEIASLKWIGFEIAEITGNLK